MGVIGRSCLIYDRNVNGVMEIIIYVVCHFKRVSQETPTGKYLIMIGYMYWKDE